MKALLLLLLAASARAEIKSAPVIITPGASNIGTVSGSTVTVLQGTNPWNITGSTITVASDITLTTGSANIGTVSGSSVTAFQGGEPWAVTSAQLGSYAVTPGTGTFPISAAALPLPSGAATEATLAAVSTTAAAIKLRADLLATESTLAAFKALVSTNGVGVLVDASKSTSPISVASLPLPLGAATEATAAAVSSNVAVGFRQGQLIGNTSFQVYQSSPAWTILLSGQSGGALAVTSTATVASGQVGGAWGMTSTSTVITGQNGGALAVVSTATVITGQSGGALTVTSTSTVIAGQSGGAFATTSTNTVISTGSITAFQGGPWGISASSASTAVTAYQSTSPWVTSPVERQQALAGKYFSTTSDFVTFSNSNENPLFLFVNLSTNTKAAYFDNHRISFAANNTGGGIAVFRVYRSPVITSSGTALSIFPGNVNSGNTSQMQAFKSPTTSSNGTVVYSAASAGGTVILPLQQSRIFAPGTSFLITIDNPGNNLLDSYDVEWSEE